jgi:CRP-like cAMP-binding protein
LPEHLAEGAAFDPDVVIAMSRALERTCRECSRLTRSTYVTQSNSAHPINRKMESIFDLSADERTAIADLPLLIREFKAGQDVARERDRPSQCCVMLEGLACRYKILPGGRRQIFSFHIPGDIPDLQSLHIDVMDHNLSTIVVSKVASYRIRSCASFYGLTRASRMCSGATP